MHGLSSYMALVLEANIRMLTLQLFILKLTVPSMTATSGMENAVGSGKVSTRDDRLHRGRKVTSVRRP